MTYSGSDILLDFFFYSEGNGCYKGETSFVSSFTFQSAQ